MIHLENFCLVIFLMFCVDIHNEIKKVDPQRTSISYKKSVSEPTSNPHEELIVKELKLMQEEAMKYNIALNLNHITYSIERDLIDHTSEIHADSEGSTLGVCKKVEEDGKRHLSFTIKLFKSKKYNIRNTIYHEVGHCVFDLPHIDKIDSIMYQNNLSDFLIQQSPERWSNYKKEFFEHIALNQQDNHVIARTEQDHLIERGQTLSLGMRNFTHPAPFLMADARFIRTSELNEISKNIRYKISLSMVDINIKYAEDLEEYVDAIRTKEIMHILADFELLHLKQGRSLASHRENEYQ